MKIHFVAQSGAQSDQTAALYAYPNWTVIQTPDIGPIARIEIQSLEYAGEGPALAGVRAFNRNLVMRPNAVIAVSTQT